MATKRKSDRAWASAQSEFLKIGELESKIAFYEEKFKDQKLLDTTLGLLSYAKSC